MDTRKLWKRVPAKSLERKVYGRIIRAYRHDSGALLLHYKPLSRNHREYLQLGMWYVCVDRKLVRRKMYRGAEIKVAPTRWALDVLNRYLQGLQQMSAEATSNSQPVH